MERLTVNKNVSEMNMVELAHNSCFAKDRKATYRDFELEIDARDFIRKIGSTFGVFENDCEELTNNVAFDETMNDFLQYGYDDKEGLLALLYRNLWAQAGLYEKLKYYEDLEEKGVLFNFPCKAGSVVYLPNNYANEVVQFEIVGISIFKDETVFIDDSENEYHIEDFGKTVFLTQAEAEEALRRMEREGNQ